MDFSTLGQHVKNPRVFRGSKTKPFLAPRGVWATKPFLLVSDTGQNRVFIFKSLPLEEFEEPILILGQQQVVDSGRNAQGTVSASTLHYPSGIWSDGKRIVLADAWNHRVLIWNQWPSCNAAPADVVLGQPNFESNQVNVDGISANPTDKSLHWPYGVYSDGKRLWIADTGNRRVLFYNSIPKSSYQSADQVIGKPDFVSKDFDPMHAIWPYSVKVSNTGVLAITDTQFYRTLVWNHWGMAFDQPANVIIGQPNIEASGQNQFGLFPDAHTLNWTYDTCFFKKGILVNDTGNSRLLYFKKIPQNHNQPADAVIGKRDFKTSSENKDTMLGTESSLYWPFSVCNLDEELVIADTGNHRLLFTKLNF